MATTGSTTTREVDEPMAVVSYNSRDITADLQPFLIELTYTDHLEGESDSLDIQLEDVDGRWVNGWYPTQGDTLTAKLGYARQALLPCGDFEIDEIDLDGPPDVVTIKALSAGVKRSVRTHRGRAYENTTLAAIAGDIAKRNKMTVVGTIDNIVINRATQVFESDLSFLYRLAAEYGHAFNVKGRQLVFFKRDELRKGEPVATLTRLDCVSRYRLHDKVHGIVGGGEVTWHDPHAKQPRVAHVKDTNTGSNRSSADLARRNVRAESQAQADAKAKALLDKNDDQTGCTITVIGSTRLVAGVTVLLATFGKFDGKYLVVKAVHRMRRSGGYTTEVDLKRVRA